VFAGICDWRKITEEEKTITCGKFEGGEVEYGILKELGVEETKEMTVAEISEKLGYDVKIIK